jgi:hypothetical protein
VALGIVFLDESPGPGAVVGLLLILVGSWFATSQAPRRVEEATAAVPEAQCCASADLQQVS